MPISMLDEMLLPEIENGNELLPFSSQGNSNQDEPIFEESDNSIVINNTVGSIYLTKGYGHVSNWELAIWLPNDDLNAGDEDTTVDENEVLKYFKISIDDDGAHITGDLSDELMEYLTITENDMEIRVDYNIPSLTVSVPTNISLEDVAVVTMGENRVSTLQNQQIASDKTLLSIKTNEIKFDCFPSIVNNQLNVNFSGNQVEGQVLILLFDENGRKVGEQIFENISVKEVVNAQFDLNNMPAQKYYVVVKNNFKKFVKQIVKL